MPGTTVVVSTESVDVSAMLLAQTFDDVLFTKTLNENARAADEITDALQDLENQIVFYGVVNMPDWFINQYDKERMFGDPRQARHLLRRNDVIARLSDHGVNGVRYYGVNDDTNYTRLRERLGRKFDLVVRNGMTITHTVSNAEEFNRHKRGANFACKHIDPIKKIRIFLGLSSIIEGDVLGASLTEKRRLSFQEQLSYGASVDVRNHIQHQFDEGILTEAMGSDQERQNAWTEQIHQKVDDMEGGLVASLRAIATAMRVSYDLDFCALDVVGDNTGALYVTNCTASPSLSNGTVLEFVSDYYKELLTNGRVMTKERLVRLVQGLSEEQVINAATLLRREGVLVSRA